MSMIGKKNVLWKVVVLAGGILAQSGAAQAESYILPSSSYRMGANAAEYRTDVRLLNQGTSAVTITATFYEQVTSTAFPASPFPIEARSQASFDNILQSLFGKTLSQGAYGPIRFDATGPILVASNVNNVNACGTGAVSGQWLPGIAAPQALKAGVIGQLAVSASTSSGYRTNLVFMNPGSSAATAAVKVRRGGGALLSTGTIGPLPANGFSQVALDSAVFPGVAGTTDTNLWLEFTSDQPVLAYATMIHNVSGDPFAVVASSGTQPAPYILPSSSFRTGANAAEYRTDVRLLNQGTNAVTVTATFYDQVTSTTFSANPFPIEAQNQAAFDNILQSLFGKTLSQGAFGPIRFDATGPILVASNVNNVNACGTGAVSGQWLPGIAASQALKAGVIGQLAVSASTASGYRTNLVFMNPGGAAATATVKVRRGGGALLSTGTIGPLPANGFSQVALDSAVFPGVAGATDTNLWLEFTSDQPVLAYTTMIHNVSGDPFAVVASSDTSPINGNWTQLVIPSIDAPAIAYDAAHGQVVLFGGMGLGTGYLNDTWVWDGSNWTQKKPAVSPPARYLHSMAYDAAHGQVVLYGGWDSSGREDGPLNDTWVWDGSNWTKKSPALSPGGKNSFAMAYDAVHGQVVLFGGWNGLYEENDTWVWDGSSWTEKSPALNPPDRYNHSLAYDAAHGQVVLFGGRQGSKDLLNDTWVWDGSTWTQKSPAHSPPAMVGHSMAYDAEHEQVVLFGDTYRYGTWVWDGTNWTQKSPALTPSARGEAAMAYDTAHRQVVLFGGAASSADYFGDTWVWDGSTWTKRSGNPGARSNAAMAYDAAREQVVLFGAANQRLTDTWVWDGNSWSLKSPTLSPGARGWAAMAYDAAHGQAVLFGGEDFGTKLNDTWVWDGTAWTKKNPAHSPSARGRHAMAYDAARGQVVLFGGGYPESALDDTWVWDGSDWTRTSPTLRPPARCVAAMAYDAAHGQVVLFGGQANYSSSLGDTWVWDGINWTRKTPTLSPPGRGWHAMAYDAALGRVLLFGGSTVAYTEEVNDTWVWDGSNWTQESPALSPSARIGAGMAYDIAHRQIVLYGGGDFPEMSDTWAWPK
jgi:hypothetical protein